MEYNIQVYSKYADSKYLGFTLDVVDPVTVGPLHGLKDVPALLNGINYDVEPVHPVIFRSLVKRKQLQPDI